jgi:hypothetical protein
MSKAERIFQLAQEVTGAYDLLNAQRAGSGNSYTREVVDHLKGVVTEEFGPGLVNQFLCKANRQCVDFWIEEERAIVELEYCLESADPQLEKMVFKALLAQDAGRVVENLILIGGPGAVRRWQALTPRSIMNWLQERHGIRLLLWELRETGPATRLRDEEMPGSLFDGY